MIYRIGQRLDMFFYTKKQTYEVSYFVKVTNKLDKKNFTKIISPIPKNNEYQTIENLRFKIEPNLINKDELYSNEYALWDEVLKFNESFEIVINFMVEVQSRTFQPRSSLGKMSASITDYTKDDQYKIYTSPNKYILSKNERIIKIANDVTKGSDDVQNKIKEINKYVVNNLTYGKPISGLYSATDALDNECVDCGGFASLMVSLCRAIGIPARTVFGFRLPYKDNDMHAWVEILLPDGTWMPADPSIEHLFKKNRSRLSGKLGFIGSDRVNMSVGSDMLIKTSDDMKKIDILQNSVVFASEGDKSYTMEYSFKAKRL